MSRKKRRTMGNDPLDAVVPQQPSREEEPSQDDTTDEGGTSKSRDKGRKKRLTVHLPVDLQDHLRDAVYWSPGVTLSGLVEQAVREKLKAMEEDREEPFPSREEELRPGPPVA